MKSNILLHKNLSVGMPCYGIDTFMASIKVPSDYNTIAPFPVCLYIP